MKNHLKEYMLSQLEAITAVPSPTGFTKMAQEYVVNELKNLGYEPKTLVKGGVLVCLGGEGNPLCYGAHYDTIAAVVRSIKPNGHLKVTPVGGLHPNSVEGENVTVFTRFNGTYEGTFQPENGSVHVNVNADAPRSFETVTEVVLDEMVRTAEETKALGVCNGDFIVLDPRYTVTSKGFIKSRFLDDKAAVAIQLTLAKAVKEGEVKLGRKVYLVFTDYEEIGHGGSAGVPEDCVDVISIDMGCVGSDLDGYETKVSICAKDTMGPYNYDLTTELIQTAKKNSLDFAVDIYPRYGSDVECTIKAGYDIRHGLVGPGVYISHGYERTHIDGLVNTYKLVSKYAEK